MTNLGAGQWDLDMHMEDGSMSDATVSEDGDSTAESDDGGDNRPSKWDYRWELRCPPNAEAARMALADIQGLLWPQRADKKAYLPANLGIVLEAHLRAMKDFLIAFTDFEGRSNHHALSWIEDEELAADIKLYLQSLGKYICAMDIVKYLEDPIVQKQHSLNRTISLSTAQQWLHKLGYRWKKEKQGQYSDGHEHDDVVHYHQNIFLPEWSGIELSLQNWKFDDPNQEYSPPTTSPSSRHVVVWFHDESTFYANDHHKVRWEHISEDALPQPKGEGASIMVSHFISPDYGFLHSPDGKESACVLFRAGKSHNGYYSSNDILKQAAQAMDILVKYFPEEDHIFVFDNATTHLKRADDALSACHMPKNPSKSWGPEAMVRDDNGKPIMGPDNKPLKMKIPMAPGHFPDGTSQPLYFPVGHPQAGWFKGMSQILQEHGYDVKGLLTECKGFKCPEGWRDCCCHRILFNEPDFKNVESLLEATCQAQGVQMCWGYAKRIYHLNPPSSKEADLERNVVTALAAIPLTTMHWFAMQSHRFIDAYKHGLNGAQAAWAVRKYHGH
ncbi:hypothetical protein F5141DRAFT_1064423 [Pisolithus sp. B1]|nr:hypothetical protein F5141DRAFT_1064423 [Pisolithus sp. B1]